MQKIIYLSILQLYTSTPATFQFKFNNSSKQVVASVITSSFLRFSYNGVLFSTLRINSARYRECGPQAKAILSIILPIQPRQELRTRYRRGTALGHEMYYYTFIYLFKVYIVITYKNIKPVNPTKINIVICVQV